MPISPRVVVVFLKFPVPGKVKTRLAAGLSGENPGEEAVSIYKRLVTSVFGTLAQSDISHLRIEFDPPDRASEIRDWLRPDLKKFPDSIDIGFFPQTQGDLGERLQKGLETALSDLPNAKVAMIGTDCVEISPSTFSETWNALENGGNDIVFGPTFDGGYYLVAAAKPAPEIFTDIPWSTEDTLPASLKAAENAGRQVAQISQLNDVDTIEDWEIAQKHIFETTGSVR